MRRCLLSSLVLLLIVQSTAATAGALFTTMCDGTVVNANVQYPTKYDVYLNGGPQNCAGAAGLTDGWYFFQITDPSSKVLLSTDSVLARQVLVQGGYFVQYSNSGCTTGWPASGSRPAIPAASADQCVAHLQCAGKCPGTITVQMMPYLDTPNPGGEYKAWVVPITDYTGNDTNNFGFVDSPSKTDNYKAKFPVTTQPPTTAPIPPITAPPATTQPSPVSTTETPTFTPHTPPATPTTPATPPTILPTFPATNSPSPDTTTPSQTSTTSNVPTPETTPDHTQPLPTTNTPTPSSPAQASTPPANASDLLIPPTGSAGASSTSGHLSGAAIAGIVIAVVAVVAAVGLMAAFFVLKMASNGAPDAVHLFNSQAASAVDNPLHQEPYQTLESPLHGTA